jgi:hypothetical protein
MSLVSLFFLGNGAWKESIYGGVMRFKKGVLSMLLAMPVLSIPLEATPITTSKGQQPIPQQQLPVQQDPRQQDARQQDQGGKGGRESQDQQWGHFVRSVDQMRNRCIELQRATSGKDGGFGSQLQPFNITLSCGGTYEVMTRTPHSIPFPSRTQLITDFSSNKHNSSTSEWAFAERGTAAKCTIVQRNTHETRGDMAIQISGKDCEQLYADKLVARCRDEVVHRCTDGDCEQARGISTDTCTDLERARG